MLKMLRLGTLTVATPAAQCITAKASINLSATMTVINSVGQIASQSVANSFYTMDQNFNGSLWVAGIAFIAAACISSSILARTACGMRISYETSQLKRFFSD